MQNSKPVAKSLHTVTVLVQVARHLQRRDPRGAIAQALVILGLHDRPDPYGLAAAALKQMGFKL